jgi:hypothetical protein
MINLTSSINLYLLVIFLPNINCMNHMNDRPEQLLKNQYYQSKDRIMQAKAALELAKLTYHALQKLKSQKKNIKKLQEEQNDFDNLKIKIEEYANVAIRIADRFIPETNQLKFPIWDEASIILDQLEDESFLNS